jgi:hypothetical protein
MSVKERMPWPLKIAAKLVLARLPVSYRSWSRLGIFRHGAMDEPAYAIDVVRTHLERAGIRTGEPFTALELGPGDSIASAIVARAFGASETYLVDVDRFANSTVEAYAPLVDVLAREGFAVPDLHGVESIDDLCARCGAHYLTDGIASLRTIPSGSIDVVWSQAVLEHVRASEFDEVQRELRRTLRASGLASHRVDLQDHLALSLNNLRFGDRLWERPAIWNSGFYTNRMRCRDIIESMTQASFHTEIVGIERWSELPVRRQRLAPRFRSLPVDELRVRWFDVLARPT